ncbi:exodeoxyribonuclease VII large subunit [Porticoccaceae bacterium]|jgi:exodeoxyribonuclease VII large subunit|nr:exodeoxyribonuclease VII large subunit [Porticoccaceae bacterium]CAI8375318.1 MAG: Exodeoxyribonuclease 7 large subunit [SAR92 bacterium MED-G29]|tara:strand:- start:14260 stop:15609 length:1350 start_codon:yes stop_codon:yes gene_type:complete
MITNPTERQILSVSQLNRSVRHLLETQLPMLWVEGEISNFARPASGHWYLTLKDDQAQVRCAMFRNTNQRVGFQPANGTQVLVRCRAGLYEGRGEYQLVIEHMEEAGFGALQRQFEMLKQQLSTEGLFDTQHKQPMPESVRHIGVITSATGAAVKDILSVLNRRFPSIRVSIFPTAVQGAQAAGQIIEAINNANRQGQCDALIVGRGGGSLEDLWPFNEETVARAIFASEIPIVSAVGHEVDFTIADFVADLRAPTPSAAAELLSPDGEDMLNQFEGFEILLGEAMTRKIRQLEQRTDYLQKRLQHPGRKLQEQAQHLDHLDIRLRRAMAGTMQQQAVRMKTLGDKLVRQNPRDAIVQRQQLVANAVKHMMRAVSQQLESKQNKTAQAMHLLDTVSPLKTLGRGYSIIRDNNDAVIRSVAAVKAGDELRGQLVDGEVVFAVTGTNNKII